MKKILWRTFFPLLIVSAILLTGNPAFSEAPDGRMSPSLAKTSITDLEVIDGNNIFNYSNNLGGWCTHNNPIGWGMQWPGESGLSMCFAAGVWFGGKVGEDIRTAAAEFAYEFQPGIINPDGTPDDPDKNIYQILKINKADLSNEGEDNPDYDLWVNEAYMLGAPIEKAADGSDSLSASGKRIPAMIGDQMAWMVFNDANPGKHSLFQTSPIGIEVQNLIWVFNRPDEFGDMMFIKYTIVNKGGHTVEDAFGSLWFDIDLGDSNDDLVFCDTTLSLGGFWNDGADNEYAIAPACGADFFQGPIVPSPGDTANISGTKVPDYKNLPMSSFAKYIRGGPTDTQDPETAIEAYNFMLGLNGLGQEVMDPTTNLPTKFVNVSDPEAGTGWVDGTDLSAADRRMMMNTGPFTMQEWEDTNGDGLAQAGEPGVQEIVCGFMVAQGTDARNSATRLIQADEKAQLAYDLDFALPPSPPIPEVTVHQLDEEIVLTWTEEAESYTAEDNVDVDEEGNPTFYTFQGYNIYQSDSPTIGPDSRVIKLATFDIVDGVKDIRDFTFSNEFGENVEATVQRATDSGIQRYFAITSDAIRGGETLRNWNTYWFIVTSYGYNEIGVPRMLESPFETIAVTPMPAQGGLVTDSQFMDQIAFSSPDTSWNATHTTTAALSNGGIEVFVIDPLEVTGMDYEVSFEVDEESGETFWNLDRLDASGKVRVLSKQSNQEGDEDYLVADGLLVKVLGAPLAFAGDGDGIVEVAYAGTPLTSDQYDAAGTPYGGNKVWHSLNNGDGESRYFLSANDHGEISRLMRYIAFAVPFDFELRFTDELRHAVQPFDDDKICTVPFELWNIGSATPDDPSDDMQMIPFILPNDSTKPFFGWANDVDGYFGLPASDVIYWFRPKTATSYEEFNAYCVANGGPGAIYPFPGDGSAADDYFGNWDDGFVYPIGRLMVGEYDEDNAPPPAGTVVRFHTTKPNTVADVFKFSTSGLNAVKTAQSEEVAAQLVNIFPNPYFGQNRAEINPVERFMTLTHLKENGMTIRIFTLAGDLIKTIDDAVRQEQGTLGTNTATWDLRNDFDVPVASGIYIIHVDMGDLGEKVLKAAVFMPEERLDKF